jgi:hypothetical protein
MRTWRVRIESAWAVVLDGQAEKANRELVGGCCGEHVPERALPKTGWTWS